MTKIMNTAGAETAAVLDSVRQNGEVYNLFSTLAQHPQLVLGAHHP